MTSKVILALVLSIALIAVVVDGSLFSSNKKATIKNTGMVQSIFDFTVDNSSGDPVRLSTYRGKKAILIVNVASE